jgi:hypothetical protein
MPDSSTGGYLAPSSTGGDLNDDALVDALQAAVVGIVGLPGAMVRPRWQPEPPDPPEDPTTDWAAIGPGVMDRDWNAARVKKDANTTVIIRNRVIEVLCSFYGANAQANCELLANGFEIPQNREPLGNQGLRLIGGVSAPVVAPALLKGRWYPRYDISFKVRQQQQYTYSVLDLAEAKASLYIQPPGEPVIQESIDVKAP